MKNNLDVSYYAEFQNGKKFYMTNRLNKEKFEDKVNQEITSGNPCTRREEITNIYQSPDLNTSINRIFDEIKGKFFYHIECIEEETEYELEEPESLISLLKGKIPDSMITQIYNLIITIDL